MKQSLTNIVNLFYSGYRNGASLTGTNPQHSRSTVLLYPRPRDPKCHRNRLQMGKPGQMELDTLEEWIHLLIRDVQPRVRMYRHNHGHHQDSERKN